MIVADTHALIWWINASEELSPIARKRMNREGVSIAAITVWEIALLHQRRRIAIADPERWFERVLRFPMFTVHPITMEIAMRAADLSNLMRDPADCMIAATALHHGVPLVTKDERIRNANVVETIW